MFDILISSPPHLNSIKKQNSSKSFLKKRSDINTNVIQKVYLETLKQNCFEKRLDII